MLRQSVRPGEQAEQHEHHDLCQPGGGVEKDDHGIVRARRPIADDQAGQIDGEKTGGVQRLGKAEHDERAGGDERRVQALRQVHAIEHDHGRAAAEQADVPPPSACSARSSATPDDDFPP